VPIVPCVISGSNRPGKWWYRGVRPRLWFGGVRPWQELAGEGADLAPGRALYQRVADAVMREIAELKNGQKASASRAGASERRSQNS